MVARTALEQLDEDEREQERVERGGGGDVDSLAEAVDQLVDRVAEEQKGTDGEDHRDDHVDQGFCDPDSPFDGALGRIHAGNVAARAEPKLRGSQARIDKPCG